MDAPGQPLIRQATPADAVLLSELGAATFVEAFGHVYASDDLASFLARSQTPVTYRTVFQDPTVAAWLAVGTDSQPVGFVVAGGCKLPVAEPDANAGEIRQLYVRAAFQKHQLGTRLLVTALQWLVAQERAPIYVGVWSQNFGAQRLYARFGFEKVGEYDFAVGEQLDREFILRQVTSDPGTRTPPSSRGSR